MVELGNEMQEPKVLLKRSLCQVLNQDFLGKIGEP